jgi:hypothetical protein
VKISRAKRSPLATHLRRNAKISAPADCVVDGNHRGPVVQNIALPLMLTLLRGLRKEVKLGKFSDVRGNTLS